MELYRQLPKTAGRVVNGPRVRVALLALTLAALLPAKMVLASGSATANLSVSATVVATCTVSTTAVNFGTYDPSAAGDTKAQGAITLVCASGLAPKIAMDNGQFNAQVSKTNSGTIAAPVSPAKTSSGQTITRAMQSAGQWLGYDLFTDSSYATVWNATNTVSPGTIGSLQPVTLQVFGDIPAKQVQTLGGGTYNDTVVVTVTF